MRDQLVDLLARIPVAERAPDVAVDLVGTVERGERGDGDEAAVALGEPRALPHVAEHDLVGELAQLRKDVADLPDGGRRSHGFSPGGIPGTDSTGRALQGELRR